jgi:selenocysteine lyase/cysteine desulfurase
MPRCAIRALQEATEWQKFPHRLPDGLHWELPNRVRSLLAQLINSHADDIAITTGASGGLAAVAASLDWKPSDEVLIAEGEFPAHFTTFVPLAEAGRLRVRIVKPAGKYVAASDFIAQLSPKTRLVSVSLVRFDNGARLDARRVARRRRDAD